MFCLPLFCCLLRSLGLRFCPGANAQRLYHAVSCPNVVSDSDAHGDSNTISLAFPFREGAGYRKTSGCAQAHAKGHAQALQGRICNRLLDGLRREIPYLQKLRHLEALQNH